MDTKPLQIGQRLREERLKRLTIFHQGKNHPPIKNPEFNAVNFCKKLGISVNALWKYEKGKLIPPLPLIMRMADVLGVSAEYLIFGKKAPPPGQAK